MASLPAGDTTQRFFFSSADPNSPGLASPTPTTWGGRFRLTFTGSATVTGTGITNLTQIDANTYEFDCDWSGNKWLTFTPTAFPIKVSIVKTTDLVAHSAGGIFRQEFLDSVPAGGCFRFMDWMGTNNSGVANLADYPVASSQRWNRVPLSAIVNLCNAKSADPWINIPHQASDALVTDWATYLRDNLNSSLRIRVELSNEIWNTGTFTQGSYFKAQAEAVWGVADGYGGGGYWLDYAGKRFAQIMAIFNSVLAGQTNRLIGVLAGQAASAGLAVRMLDAPHWQVAEPGSYVRPSSLAKEWSIAPYIGWSSPTSQGNTIKAALDVSYADGVQAIKDQFVTGLNLSKGYINSHIGAASSRGLRLTAYEYNNHFDLNAAASSALYSGGNPVAGAFDAFFEATYSQEMADAQDELRAYFKSQNGSLMCFFVDANAASRFGTWGARTHFAHNSAIWNDLVAWHTANPRWWAR